MRLSTLAAAFAFIGVTHSASAQQQAASQHLSRLEKEILARIPERATTAGGFQFGTGELDLRLPLRGEPEEIVGPTAHASDALAVGSARVEPLDSILSREETFGRARYSLRLEDRTGKCL